MQEAIVMGDVLEAAKAEANVKISELKAKIAAEDKKFANWEVCDVNQISMHASVFSFSFSFSF